MITIRSRWWLLVMMAALTLMLASCGGSTAPAPAEPAKEEAKTEEEAAPAQEEADTEEEAAPAQEEAKTEEEAAPASGEKTKITWWTEATDDQYRDLIQKEFVDTFNAAHPDIELEI